MIPFVNGRGSYTHTVQLSFPFLFLFLLFFFFCCCWYFAVTMDVAHLLQIDNFRQHSIIIRSSQGHETFKCCLLTDAPQRKYFGLYLIAGASCANISRHIGFPKVRSRKWFRVYIYCVDITVIIPIPTDVVIKIMLRTYNHVSFSYTSWNHSSRASRLFNFVCWLFEKLNFDHP